MRPLVDLSTIVLVVLALALAGVAYVKDPGLPLLGAKNGFSMLKFILPRLVPALMLAGLMQVLIPEAVVSRHFGREGGLRAILIATLAGVLTPGGPMVSVPFMVALANSGAALPSLVAYMTSWSLFGVQRIIAWEAPLMGWHFVVVRVIPSLAFPIVAGWLVAAFGAADRLALALGVGTLDELGERVAKLLDVKLPGTFAERLRKLGTLFDLVKAGPRRVTDAPCQEVVETERPSLASLPVLR